jgi:hypothetical protein
MSTMVAAGKIPERQKERKEVVKKERQIAGKDGASPEPLKREAAKEEDGKEGGST